MIDKATRARAHAWRRGWEDGACGRPSRAEQEMDELQNDYWIAWLGGWRVFNAAVGVASLRYPGLTMADFDLMSRIG